jgi:hypothetical protein
MSRFDAWVASLPLEQQIVASSVANLATRRLARLAGTPLTDAEIKRYSGGIAVGMFMDAEPPGTINGECGDCGRLIRIGPDSQRILAREFGVATLCVVCAQVAIARLDDAGVLSDHELEIHRAADVLRGWEA